MRDDVREVSQGDPITAAWLTEVARGISKLSSVVAGSTAGGYKASTGSFQGQASRPTAEQRYVEMLYAAVPEDAAGFSADASHYIDNACVLVWSEEDGDWVADPGNELTVRPHSGQPLADGDRLWVQLDTATDRWFPVAAPAAAQVGTPVLTLDLATRAPLAAYTRAGNTITANSNGVMADIDGVTPAAGTRFLLRDGAAGADNGPYSVDSVGSAGSKWSATRVAEWDTSAEAVPGTLMVVTRGAGYADHVFQVLTDGPITLNTTALAIESVTYTGCVLPARVTTAAALAAYTRAGNTITANANGAIAAVDGVTLAAGDRLLLRHGAAGADNGLWEVTQVGSAGTPFVLTRTVDADTSAKVKPGLLVTVSEGSAANQDTLWVLTKDGPITINNTSITFAKRMQLTVRELDGSPSYSGIVTLTLDQADGFIVSQPAAGEVRVDIDGASATQAGIVTLGTQTWAGFKKFQDNIFAGKLFTSGSGSPPTGSYTLVTGTSGADGVELWDFVDGDNYTRLNVDDNPSTTPECKLLVVRNASGSAVFGRFAVQAIWSGGTSTLNGASSAGASWQSVVVEGGIVTSGGGWTTSAVAALTNNVTSGGTNDKIDDWSDLTTYANDAAAIRNAVYQLARKLKQVVDGLRTAGLFT